MYKYHYSLVFFSLVNIILVYQFASTWYIHFQCSLCEPVLLGLSYSSYSILTEFQETRREHEFFEVCRTPELACEVTLQVCLHLFMTG